MKKVLAVIALLAIVCIPAQASDLSNTLDKVTYSEYVELDSPKLIKINEDLYVGCAIQKSIGNGQNVYEDYSIIAKITADWTVLDLTKVFGPKAE